MLRATCIANPISIISIDFAFETELQMLHDESLTAAISTSVGAREQEDVGLRQVSVRLVNSFQTR